MFVSALGVGAIALATALLGARFCRTQLAKGLCIAAAIGSLLPVAAISGPLKRARPHLGWLSSLPLAARPAGGVVVHGALAVVCLGVVASAVFVAKTDRAQTGITLGAASGVWGVVLIAIGIAGWWRFELVVAALGSLICAALFLSLLADRAERPTA